MDTIGRMGPDIHREDSIPFAGAVIVAAGSGERLGAGVPKALVEVGGRSLVAWCLDAFDRSPRVAAIVIVAPAGHLPAFRERASGARTPVAVVPGGATRADSVASPPTKSGDNALRSPRKNDVAAATSSIFIVVSNVL